MTKNGNITEFRNNGTMLGWISKVMKRRATFSIAIHKVVCDGVALRRGQTLYCYFSEENNRPILKVYLDGKNKNGETK